MSKEPVTSATDEDSSEEDLDVVDEDLAGVGTRLSAIEKFHMQRAAMVSSSIEEEAAQTDDDPRASVLVHGGGTPTPLLDRSSAAQQTMEILDEENYLHVSPALAPTKEGVEIEMEMTSTKTQVVGEGSTTVSLKKKKQSELAEIAAELPRLIEEPIGQMSAVMNSSSSILKRQSDIAIAFKNVHYKVVSYRPKIVHNKNEVSVDVEGVGMAMPSVEFQKTHHILRDVTGYIPTGSLCAVIGHSGAGKTTFMGLAAGIPLSGDMKGTVAASTKRIAFVSQYPSMPAHETVFEYLRFCCGVSQAKAGRASPDHIFKEVDRVIGLLRLTKVRKNQIRTLSGGERKRCSIASQLVTHPGILFLDEPTSGLDTPHALSIIQRLRAIIADSGNKTTIIVSIHQPQRRICAIFDWVLSFHLGRLIWQGPFESAIAVRNELLDDVRNLTHERRCTLHVQDDYGRQVVELADLYNIELKRVRIDTSGTKSGGGGGVRKRTKSEDSSGDTGNTSQTKKIDVNLEKLGDMISDIMCGGQDINSGNPADYLLETEYLATTEQLIAHWKGFVIDQLPGFEEAIAKACKTLQPLEQNYYANVLDFSHLNSWTQVSDSWEHGWRAFVGLSWRTMRCYKRHWQVVVANMMVSIVAGVCLGLIYGELGHKQQDVQNRFGSLGFVTIFIGIQSVAATGTFIDQREIFIDERNGQLYGPMPFLLGRAIPDLFLMRVLPSIVFGVIIFEMLGYQCDAATTVEYMVTVGLLAVVTSMFVFMVSSVSPTTYVAGMVAIFANLLFMLYGGIFIQNNETMPWIVRWPKYMSFYAFAYEILFINEMRGLTFVVDDADVSVNGSDITTEGYVVTLSGDYFIKFFGFDKDNKHGDYVFLISWITVYFCMGVFALQFLHRSKR